MKLYLSSFRLGDHPEEFLKLLDGKKRIAVINNALDATEPSRRDLLRDREFDDLTSIGLEPFEIDLRHYFTAPITERDLLDAEVIWVRGGNVFNLRRAFAYSAFGELLQKWIANDKPYGGYSAGACILSKTLKGIELCDSIDDIPTGYSDAVLWEGLGILDYSIAPHYKSDHPESERIDKVVQYFSKHGMPYKTLCDGEVLIIHNDKQVII